MKKGISAGLFGLAASIMNLDTSYQPQKSRVVASGNYYSNMPLTKKQRKARAKSKMARQSCKINRR